MTGMGVPSSGGRRLEGAAAALGRYRVMAAIVGVGLAVLCFVGVPLQLAGGNKWPWTSVVDILGPVHGIFYVVYLIACLDLARRGRFKVLELLGMVASGWLPLLAFYTERVVTKKVRAELAATAAVTPVRAGGSRPPRDRPLKTTGDSAAGASGAWDRV